MPEIREILMKPETRGAMRAGLYQMRPGIVARALVKAVGAVGFNRDKFAKAVLTSIWEVLGDREAIICDDTRITFKQFRDRSLRLANGLRDLGLEPGDRFAELLYNGPEWFECMGAGGLAGCSMPMLNWHLRSKELVECINKSHAKAVVFDSSFLEIILENKDKFEQAEHLIMVGGDEVPEGVISYEELIAHSSDYIPDGDFRPAPAPFSGGTTGTPKFLNVDEMSEVFGDSDEKRRGASKREVAALGLMHASALHFYKVGKIRDPYTKNIRSLIPGPLYHAGVQVGVLPFFLGGTVVPMRKFTPEGFLALIEKERINWTFVAPTMLERILALPDEVKSKYNLSSMVSLICAAAPCPPAVKKEINELFKRQGAKAGVFHEYYGASETGLVTILAPEDYEEKEERYNSVGKIRASECKIYDLDNNTWAEVGKEGKVLVRSPMTLGLQYQGQKDKTEEAFIHIDGKAWYDDGLIGYVDEDDFLYLTSRAKEMIISGGVNVFPNEIEHVIKLHPKVFDVAVIRAPDPDLGEVAAAVIQLKKEESLTQDEVLQFCKDEGLYGFKMPKIVDFEEELPRQLSGKLIKRVLEERYWEGVEKHG
ncbi:MAG TPA: hypothetical protein DCZ03_00055 [Gammaproteobacteria bacterium]|nr:hypothetical protein [Gammaproteobacteria bacterium]